MECAVNHGEMRRKWERYLQKHKLVTNEKCSIGKGGGDGF